MNDLWDFKVLLETIFARTDEERLEIIIEKKTIKEVSGK
jgi:hypothetical protein